MTDEWWPDGFDYPAFRVKRQTYSLSEGGDYARGSSVETLPSTALRYPTRSLDPTAFEGASRGQLFAKAFDYHTVEIEWNWPRAVEDIFVEVAMVRSTYGAPIAPNQGQTIFRVLRDDLPKDYSGESEFLNPPPLIYDQQLPPGHWYYYTAFFRTNAFDWTAVMSDSTLLPRDYGHANHLWNALPPYYQWTDDNYRAGGGHLRSFLTIFGFELDRTREYVESLQKLHWIDQCPMPLLKKLGENYGYPYEQGLGDVRYRALLTNISHLHSIRGTAKGLLEFIETVSKYDCDLTHGPNNVLLPDDSNFVTGLGHWAPMHPDWGATPPAPPAADYLSYDLVRLTLNPHNNPIPPADAPGAIGTMLVDSLDGGTLKDIFISIGCGKYLTTYLPPTFGIRSNWGTWTATAVGKLFSVTGVSAWKTWTATAEATVLNTKNLVPYYAGIPVNAGEVYGFSAWIKAAKSVTVYSYMLTFTSEGQPDDVIYTTAHGYLSPGQGTGTASTPSFAGAQVTGDTVWVAKLRKNVVGSKGHIANKSGVAWSWDWEITPTGTLRMSLGSPDGTSALYFVIAAAPEVTAIPAGTDFYLAASIQYTATTTVSALFSPDGITWTPLGTPSSVGGTYGQFSTSDPIRVGVGALLPELFDGRIYWVEQRTGLVPSQGTVKWRYDSDEYVTGTSFTDARGKLWTLTSGTAVTKKVDTVDPIPSLPHVINDADWHEVKVQGQMPVGANYLAPALYFDAREAGGVGGRSPRIDVAAVMVYKVDQAAPISITAPDRYLTLGDAAEKLGATKAGYEGFTLGAPS